MPSYIDSDVPAIPSERIERIKAKVGFGTEDIHRFLKATGWDDAKCEVCHNSDFVLEVMDGIPAPITMPAAVSSDHAKWLLSLRCGDCGNVKLVDYVFVREWLRSESNGG